MGNNAVNRTAKPYHRFWMFGISYAVLLYIVIVVAPEGRWFVRELSIAQDGSFSVCSTLNFNQMDVAGWSADLSERRRIRRYTYPICLGHSLSLDGTSVAVPVIQDDTLCLNTIDLPTGESTRRIQIPDSIALTIAHVLLFPNDAGALIVGSEMGYLVNFSAESITAISNPDYWLTSDPSRNFFALKSFSWNPELGAEESSKILYQRSGSQLRLVRVLDEYQSIAEGLRSLSIASDGTVALQNTDNISLESLNGDIRKIDLDEDEWQLGTFDHDSRRLLLYGEREISIFDLNDETFVASYKPNDKWNRYTARFQDNDHVIIAENAEYRNSRLVRRNWRTGKVVSRHVGWIDWPAAKRFQIVVVCSFSVWIGLLIMQLKNNPCGPFIVLAATSIFGCTYGFLDVSFADCQAEWNECWWLSSVGVFYSFLIAICFLLEGVRVIGWLPYYVTGVAGVLHFQSSLGPEGSTVALLSATTVTVFTSMIAVTLRATGYRISINSPNHRNDENALRISLLDALKITASLAILFAVCRRFRNLEFDGGEVVGVSTVAFSLALSITTVCMQRMKKAKKIHFGIALALFFVVGCTSVAVWYELSLLDRGVVFGAWMTLLISLTFVELCRWFGWQTTTEKMNAA